MKKFSKSLLTVLTALFVSIPSFAMIPSIQKFEEMVTPPQRQQGVTPEQSLAWKSAQLLVQLSGKLPEQLQKELNIEPCEESFEELPVETVSELILQFMNKFDIQWSELINTPAQLLEHIIEKLPTYLVLQLRSQLLLQTFKQTPARLLIQAIRQSLSET